jgi:hypothetical protein
VKEEKLSQKKSESTLLVFTFSPDSEGFVVDCGDANKKPYLPDCPGPVERKS